MEKSHKYKMMSTNDNSISHHDNSISRDRGRPHYAIVAGLCASSASLFGKLTTAGSGENDHDDDGGVVIAVTVLWQVSISKVLKHIQTKV